MQSQLLDPGSDYVLVHDIAKEFGVDASNTRRWLKANNFELFGVRAKKGCRPLSGVSAEDYQRALKLRESQGYPTGGNISATSKNRVLDMGVFYIVAACPDLSPHRIKLGFTTSIDARMADYFTIAPTAEVVKTYPCKFAWEKAAMASITRIGCKQIGVEIFDCDSVEDLVARADAFFALMPSFEQDEESELEFDVEEE